MNKQLESLKPIKGADRSLRKRLALKGELMLSLLPMATVLSVFALVKVFSNQRLLFASLASSAFLIYLDPQHGTNTVRTLVISQMLAASLGWLAYLSLGPGYLSGGTAMVITILLMILLDAMHPPAVSTSLSYAFRAGDESNLVLFGLAVLLTAMLVVLQRAAVWLLARYKD